MEELGKGSRFRFRFRFRFELDWLNGWIGGRNVRRWNRDGKVSLERSKFQNRIRSTST